MCCVGRTRRSGPAEGQRPAAERQGALEERAEGGAGASEEINPRSHTGFCSDPEPFTSRRRAQSLISKLLGLKSGFIFTCASQPICSSEPQRCTEERRKDWRKITESTGVPGECSVGTQTHRHTPSDKAVPAVAR